MVTPNYIPSAPAPGRTIIHIERVAVTAQSILIYYDIAIGPASGYGYYKYQISGNWPLIWKITNKAAGDIVRKCALEAIQAQTPNVTQLSEAVGMSLAVDIDYEDDHPTDIRVRRSYPLSKYKIAPQDIRIDSSVSWSVGSSEYIRANLMAAKAGLPVIMTDYREKQSPMVGWCAEHGIILLPASCPVGDYCLPHGKTVVDRKANILELYNDFAIPNNRPRYENAAIVAAAHRLQLVYVVTTEAKDAVHDIASLASWSAPIPGQNSVANGKTLSDHLRRYQDTFPHTSFVFCHTDRLCDTIYQQICR